MEKPAITTALFLFIAPVAIFACLITAPPAMALAGPAAASPDILYAVSRAMGEKQQLFHVREQGSRCDLKNELHDFTAIIANDGSLVIHRQGHEVRMRLLAPDAGKIPSPMPVVRFRHRDNRITLDHGLLRQWYINGPLGLQQGFTLDNRPERSDDGDLILDLDVESDLQPQLAGNGQGITFKAGKDTILTYSGLFVTDATRKRLPAHFSIRESGISIVVEDRDAVYPIVVDPVFQQAKLISSDGWTGDMFGRSVAVDGDIVVVGAPSHDINPGSGQGTAYVYKKTGTGWGNMTEMAKLTASDANPGDWFGYAVDIAGDTVVVGAISAHAGGSIRPGAAYVFVRPSSGWVDMTEVAKLTSGDGADQDQFGGDVAVAGNVIVVGADGANMPGHVNQGKAYVFVKPAGGWSNMTQTATLTAGDGGTDDYFGQAVGLDGGVIVVGAPGRQSNRGALYVFEQSGSGWTQSAELMASDGTAEDKLGSSVAIEGGTIVAGAPDFSTGGAGSQGVAYIFLRSGTNWTDMEETAELRATHATGGDHFGSSVAIDGGRVVVGAPYHDYSGTASNGLPLWIPHMGAVYEFDRPAGGWPADMRTEALFVSDDGNADDHLGSSVAIDGSTVVAGAPEHEIDGRQDQGAAYVFRFKEKTSWPLFVASINSYVGHVRACNKRVNAPDPSNATTKYTKYIGTMTLGYGNTVIPHFAESAESCCTLWMPVHGNIGQLTCSPGVLTYDVTEEEGGGKYRYKGRITFQPTGICDKSLNTCRVSDNGAGIESQWWWIWNGTAWEPLSGTPWTGSLNGFGNTYDFNLSQVLAGGETQGGCLIRCLTWRLRLMPAH